MKTEKGKMISGELYDAGDPQLTAERRQASLLLKQLNDSSDDERELRAAAHFYHQQQLTSFIRISSFQDSHYSLLSPFQ